MPPSIHQDDLFAQPGPHRHRLAESFIDEYLSAFNSDESKGYLEYLMNNIDWQSATIRIAGKTIPIPRLQCWVADPGLDYAYSGISMQPRDWTAPILEIRSRVEALSGQKFNAVLLNLYRNGMDSVAWHADDEPELGPEPVVASVSFGASRPFDLKHRHLIGMDKVRLTLHNGSLLVMGKTLQNNWLHQLPKVKTLDQARVNLTFRHIVS